MSGHPGVSHTGPPTTRAAHTVHRAGHRADHRLAGARARPETVVRGLAGVDGDPSRHPGGSRRARRRRTAAPDEPGVLRMSPRSTRAMRGSHVGLLVTAIVCGTAQLPGASFAAGSRALKAVYQLDSASFEKSSGDATVTVAGAVSTTTLTVAPDPSVAGQIV